MAIISTKIAAPGILYIEPLYAVAEKQIEADSTRYRNRVWDTQKAGSDKNHYWVTSDTPDVNGLSYDGPGTWGVHTSDLSATKLL